MNEWNLKCPLLPLGHLRLTQEMCQLFLAAELLSAFGRTFLSTPSLSEFC